MVGSAPRQLAALRMDERLPASPARIGYDESLAHLIGPRRFFLMPRSTALCRNNDRPATGRSRSCGAPAVSRYRGDASAATSCRRHGHRVLFEPPSQRGDLGAERALELCPIPSLVVVAAGGMRRTFRGARGARNFTLYDLVGPKAPCMLLLWLVYRQRLAVEV